MTSMSRKVAYRNYLNSSIHTKQQALTELKCSTISKELAKEIAPILKIIFNISYDTGTIPEQWKTAIVQPVYKKGNKYDAANYRPISLTCICCKLMEHIIASHIMNHGEEHEILYQLQHGFRKNRSCETQLLEFTDDVSKNI